MTFRQLSKVRLGISSPLLISSRSHNSFKSLNEIFRLRYMVSITQTYLVIKLCPLSLSIIHYFSAKVCQGYATWWQRFGENKKILQIIGLRYRYLVLRACKIKQNIPISKRKGEKISPYRQICCRGKGISRWWWLWIVNFLFFPFRRFGGFEIKEQRAKAQNLCNNKYEQKRYSVS